MFKTILQVITASGSPVSMPNQNASNGVIHVIDKVMFPLPLEPLTGLVTKEKRLSTLLTAVKAAGLVDTLSGKHTYGMSKNRHRLSFLLCLTKQTTDSKTGVNMRNVYCHVNIMCLKVFQNRDCCSSIFNY